MGDNGEGKTGSSSPKPPTNDNGGPIIEQSHESEEYEQDLQVVLGTIFGVIAVVGLIALAFLLYRTYRARRATLSYGHNDDGEFSDREVNIDIEGKVQPVVLLLYAYDCQIHERVVGALANFLMEACGVTVTLDLLEENEIVERGIDDWLVNRLQEADFIMVLCSLGARLRCSKKRVRFKSDGHRVLPDYFAVAVDYVAEKMRAEKQKGLSVNKFITAFMEYSTRSDTPPQLETAIQFSLMKDIHKLHTHFNTLGPDIEKSETGSESSYCENHYQETETGALLKATIEQAKSYFKENPSWMDDQIQHVPTSGPFRGGKSRKRRQNSMEQPLLMLMGTPPVLQCVHHNVSCNHVNCNVPTYNVQQPWRSAQHMGESIPPDMSDCTTGHRTDGPSSQHETVQHGLANSGISQGRQNSLPSSLASSHLTVPTMSHHTVSKSMDSFAMDQSLHPHHDGLPCFFCNSTHMDGRAECRHLDTNQCHSSARHLPLTDLSQEPSQTSLSLPPGGLGSCRSQTTILQAEVHQEWGHSNKGTPEKKSATLAGDPRTWSSDLELSTPMVPFQSLPPHHPPPSHYPPGSSTVEWGGPTRLCKWPGGYPDSPNLQDEGKNRLTHHRTLSDISISTSDSDSLYGDSLERDLHSVQNISSFLDFVNSTSFTRGRERPGAISPSLRAFSVEMAPIIKPLQAQKKSENVSSKTSTSLPSDRVLEIV